MSKEEKILEIIRQKLCNFDLGVDSDLVAEGALDSMAFMELILSICEITKYNFRFECLDEMAPTQISSIIIAFEE